MVYLKKYLNFSFKIFPLVVLLILNSVITGQSITWQRIIDNHYSNYSRVIQTHDNFYVAVGYDKVNTINKLFLSKFDIYGNVIWHKVFGEHTEGNWIEETNDNNYIICGRIFDGTDSKFYLVKADTSGNIIWEKSYNNSDNDQAKCVKQTSSNQYIITGTTFPENVGIFFIKTDSSGNVLNQKVYMNDYNQIIFEILELNSFFWGIGSISSNNGDLLLLKLNNYLDTVWTKTYGGINVDVGNSIDRINNNSIVLGGVSKSFNQNNRLESYILNIDTNSNINWQKTYSISFSETCNSIRYKQGVGIIDAGSMDSINNISHAKLRLLNLNGDILKENYYLPGTYGAGFESAEFTSDNGIIAAGYVTYSGAFEKMYIVKTDSILFAEPIGLISISTEIPNQFSLGQNYPNPFNPATKIKFMIPLSRGVDAEGGQLVTPQREGVSTVITIYDITGKQVKTLLNQSLKPGTYEISFDASGLASGVYFYKLSAGEFTDTKKMMLVK